MGSGSVFQLCPDWLHFPATLWLPLACCTSQPGVAERAVVEQRCRKHIRQCFKENVLFVVMNINAKTDFSKTNQNSVWLPNFFRFWLKQQLGRKKKKLFLENKKLLPWQYLNDISQWMLFLTSLSLSHGTLLSVTLQQVVYNRGIALAGSHVDWSVLIKSLSLHIGASFDEKLS